MNKFHMRLNTFILNMESREINKYAYNPLTSCFKIPRQEMNITRDYNHSKVSRNSKQSLKEVI